VASTSEGAAAEAGRVDEEKEDDERRGAPTAASRPRLDEQGKERAEMVVPPSPASASPEVVTLLRIG
jgi:hypothetical protein